MSDSTPTAADVVGAPFLLPGRVTCTTMWVRSVLTRAVDRIAPPPVRILESLFGLLDHRTLVALCEAEVPDLLVRRSSAADLAQRSGSDPERLERLLRLAAVRGWVRVDHRGRFCPTSFTAFLRRDHPGGWRAWVEFAAGDEITTAVADLDARAGAPEPFEAANGVPLFEWMAGHPERWRVFDEAMAAGARMHALALLAAVDWPPDGTICDVGGGTGHLLATMLRLLPDVSGTVVDLPAVVERAVDHDRLTATAGDMFASVPTGFDSYLLVNVLHDWGDGDVRRILGVVAAAAAGARILVVDADRGARPRDRIATGADVLMAALTGGGRERNSSELAVLAEPLGLKLVRSIRLASGDWVHELRAHR